MALMRRREYLPKAPRPMCYIEFEHAEKLAENLATFVMEESNFNVRYDKAESFTRLQYI